MSTLIITPSNTKALKYIQKEIEHKEGISINLLNNIDILCYNNKEYKLSTDSIRDINIKISEKSLNLKNKYLIISNFNRLSTEAQNAFLKTLEESAKEIYLISKNKSGILDTVLSRTFEINLKTVLTFSKEIQDTLEKIIFEKQISLIKEMTTKNDFAKVIKNLEYFIYKNQNKLGKQALVTSTNKLYLLKKRSLEVKLNSEIQITNIIIGLL